ncbi:MAG: hypothetical protein JRH11_25315 [Deltaproteobacteria bacterium]|nr:hypothetical protein [Deltaproteobacteria bacterium]
MAKLLGRSEDFFTCGFGLAPRDLENYLGESQYRHLGMSWFFDRSFERDLPLGGHNVRRGWHPILVQHAQYRDYLRPPATTVVVGSLAVHTDFPHHRLGTLASDHAPSELADLLWEDERRLDPSLPKPIRTVVFGSTSATQIVGRGPLPVKMRGADVYLATNLHGRAPYFTASLEAAIQAGAIAAQHHDATVERLPMGAPARGGLPWQPQVAPSHHAQP